MMFGHQEIPDLNGPQYIDGEYYSDLLAYRSSMKSEYSFLNANRAYDLYIGSISSNRFANRQRIKIQEELNKHLRFDLLYLDLENYEENRRQLAVGLSYSASSFLTLSAYTSLVFNKENNDAGFAATLHLNQQHSIRFFLNLVDFDFNKRNDLDATDLKRPLHYGLVGQWLKSEGQFLEYYFFINSPVQREFQAKTQSYEFKESKVGLRGRQAIPTLFHHISWDINAFKGTEGKRSFTPTPATDLTWDRQGLRALIQLESQPLTLGLEHNYRIWESEQGQVTHNNWMPHLWWHLYFNPQKLTPHQIDLGLEASWHKASGPMALRSTTDKNQDINARFNLRINYELSNNAYLNFLLSADLDDKFSWEGGGAQFQILF